MLGVRPARHIRGDELGALCAADGSRRRRALDRRHVPARKRRSARGQGHRSVCRLGREERHGDHRRRLRLRSRRRPLRLDARQPALRALRRRGRHRPTRDHRLRERHRHGDLDDVHVLPAGAGGVRRGRYVRDFDGRARARGRCVLRRCGAVRDSADRGDRARHPPVWSSPALVRVAQPGAGADPRRSSRSAGSA